MIGYSAQEIHELLITPYWNALNDLTAPNGNPSTPGAILVGTSAAESDAFPEDQPLELPPHFWHQRNSCSFTAAYGTREHAVFFAKNADGKVNLPDWIVAEEVGHAFFQGGALEIDRKDSAEYHPVLENLIRTSLGVLDAGGFLVATAEFFAPLARHYLTPLDPGREHFSVLSKLQDALTNEEISWSDQRKRVETYLHHLPLIAGNFLSAKYSYDIPQLLDSEPHILKATPHQLWTEYCLPLISESIDTSDKS